jgi:hypothetical protein
MELTGNFLTTRPPRPRVTPRMKARKAERAVDRGEITRGEEGR